VALERPKMAVRVLEVMELRRGREGELSLEEFSSAMLRDCALLFGFGFTS
jgi:hypothetical protein